MPSPGVLVSSPKMRRSHSLLSNDAEVTLGEWLLVLSFFFFFFQLLNLCQLSKAEEKLWEVNIHIFIQYHYFNSFFACK